MLVRGLGEIRTVAVDVARDRGVGAQGGEIRPEVRRRGSRVDGDDSNRVYLGIELAREVIDRLDRVHEGVATRMLESNLDDVALRRGHDDAGHSLFSLEPAHVGRQHFHRRVAE